MKSKILPWHLGSLLLGMAFLLAVIFVKPIGVSTQFVIADALVWQQADSTLITKDVTAKTGYASSNAYLNKSEGKYAKEAANPLNYSFIFVLAMMAGAWISSRMNGDKPSAEEKVMPAVWRNNFGTCKVKRYTAAFIAGFIVLFGARLAGGCTSGHMMSGMMQTALSGYLFALGVFVIAIPLSIILFRK